jgi:hypothetical protein
MIIRWQDVRAAGFCLNQGARRWCVRHGVDFRRLMREGIPAAELAHIDDALLRKVIEAAKNGK